MVLINNIIVQSQYIYITLIVFLLIAISYLFIVENGKQTISKLKELFRKKWLSCFLLYTSFVLSSTILGRGRTNPYQTVFAHLWFGDDAKYNYMIIENVILFIPYIFLFLKSFTLNKPLKSSLTLSICTTVFIELSQLLFWLGAFQISDIIYNILGGLIGYLIWRLFTKRRLCGSKVTDKSERNKL